MTVKDSVLITTEEIEGDVSFDVFIFVTASLTTDEDVALSLAATLLPMISNKNNASCGLYNGIQCILWIIQRYL